MLTKLLKSMMALLRQRGACSLIFLDGILVMAWSKSELKTQSHFFLQQLWFRINWEKSHILPSQLIPLLMIFCGEFYCNDNKSAGENISDISDVKAVMLRKTVSVRDVARLLGRMSATILDILPVICYQGIWRLKNRKFICYTFETRVDLDQASWDKLK